MKNSKKILVVAMAAITLMVGGITIANSTIESKAVSVTREGAQYFKKNWELSKNFDNGKATLRYGFNTNGFNEDYARAFHTTKWHYAYIKNGKGSHNRPSVAPGFTAYVDVMHSGNKVVYGNSY